MITERMQQLAGVPLNENVSKDEVLKVADRIWKAVLKYSDAKNPEKRFRIEHTWTKSQANDPSFDPFITLVLAEQMATKIPREIMQALHKHTRAKRVSWERPTARMSEWEKVLKELRV